LRAHNKRLEVVFTITYTSMSKKRLWSFVEESES